MNAAARTRIGYTQVSEVERAQLEALAGLLRARNALDAEIVQILGRPATTGNLGEFIAARIFDIHLATSGVNPGHDGVFASGPLVGKTVNVKMYSSDDALLDVSPHPADYYLVLRGPRPVPAKGLERSHSESTQSTYSRWSHCVLHLSRVVLGLVSQRAFAERSGTRPGSTRRIRKARASWERTRSR